MAFYPIDAWKNNLRDFGSAIPGIWALAAALLALFTVFWSSERQNEMQSKAYQQRKREVAAACLAESQAMWQFFSDLKVIERIRQSNDEVLSHKNVNYALHVNVNNGWLPLLSVNPEAIAVFRGEQDFAQMLVKHHNEIINIVGRINWMNSANFSQDGFDEVLNRQRQVEKDLVRLKGEAIRIDHELITLSDNI